MKRFVLAAALSLAAASALAAPSTYVIDASHTDVVASWNHLGFSNPVAHFGQVDHVRQYGTNFPDLLRSEGWQVEVKPMPLTDEQAARWGIPEREQRIYVGRRPADGA